MTYMKVFAPATIANVGPGFDIFGLALENPGDIVRIRRTDSHGVVISEIKGDNGKLPLAAEENTAGIAAIETLKLIKQKIGYDYGVEMILEKGMPLGSGMGSSGASAAAGAFAVNAVLGNILSKEELIEPCLIAESKVSGYHADNVAPSLMGGFVLIKQYNPVVIRRIEPQMDLFFVVANPDFELPTKIARAAIPIDIPLKHMIHNMGNTSSMIYSLMAGDIDLFSNSINDIVVERARAPLIKGFDEIKKEIMRRDALACSISGAGPSIFAVCKSINKCKSTGEHIKKMWADMGIGSHYYISSINREGAKVVE